jgi:hypothetical protein
MVSKMVEVKMEIRENVLKFVEALSVFSGKPVKRLLEDAMLSDFKGSLDGRVCNFNIADDDEGKVRSGPDLCAG